MGTVIENRQVRGSATRRPKLLRTQSAGPGAVPPPGSAGSVRGDFAFSVNGAREDSNNFLLDGVYNVDPKLNTFAVRPPVDAIESLKLRRAPTMPLSVATRVHKSTLYSSPAPTTFTVHLRVPSQCSTGCAKLLRPATESKPKYIRNQFGFSFGGPVRRDRTFYFADYEGTRSREGITRVTNVPTLLNATATFPKLLGIPRNPQTGQPFAGGVISLVLFTRLAQAIAALYPLPNRSSVPFRQLRILANATEMTMITFDVRFDHLLCQIAPH